MGGRRLTILGLAGALALLPGSAGAGAPTETLRAAAEKVTQVLADPALQAEARALERQPAVAAARLAAEAGPMRLGITIYLLSLLNPVAVAEEVATLDILTGGRFIFGVGLGYREVEDQAFGLAKGERVGRLVRHLDVIRRLWAGEAVTFDSPYCRLAR